MSADKCIDCRLTLVAVSGLPGAVHQNLELNALVPKEGSAVASDLVGAAAAARGELYCIFGISADTVQRTHFLGNAPNQQPLLASLVGG